MAVALEGEERLWVDHDGDGDLRNDPWPVYTRLPTRRQREVEVQLRYPGVEGRLPLRVRFYTVSDWAADRVACLVVSARRGTMRIAKKTMLGRPPRLAMRPKNTCR